VSAVSEPLKMWSNGADKVIATSEERAASLWMITVGDASSKSARPGAWQQVPGDKVMTVTCEVTLMERVIGEHAITKTAAEWVKTFGPGFMCSTEW